MSGTEGFFQAGAKSVFSCTSEPDIWRILEKYVSNTHMICFPYPLMGISTSSPLCDGIPYVGSRVVFLRSTC